MQENHVAGCVAGAVDDLQRQIAHSNGVAIFEPAVGFENLTVDAVFCAVIIQAADPETISFLRPFDG